MVAAIDSGACFDGLDAAAAALQHGVESLSGYTPRSIPPPLARIDGSYANKQLRLKASAFSAHGIAFGRTVRIDGPGTWILNAVFFSANGFAVPILGLELLVFRERMHLIVADMFPLREEDIALMDPIAPAFDDVGDDPPMPTWASRIFSRRPVFRKPREHAALADGARAVTAVSTHWLARARSAEPAPPREADDARRKRDDYIRAHALDEPANPFLSKAFGPELGKRLVDEVLFPAAILG